MDVLAEEFSHRKEDRAAVRAHVAYLSELERHYDRKQAELVWKTSFTLDQIASELKIEQQRLADEGALDERRWRNYLAGLLRAGEKADWQRAEQQKAEVFRRGQERDEQQFRRELAQARADALHQAELQAIRTDAELSDAPKRAQMALAVERLNTERERIRHEEQIRQQAAEFEEE